MCQAGSGLLLRAQRAGSFGLAAGWPIHLHPSQGEPGGCMPACTLLSSAAHMQVAATNSGRRMIQATRRAMSGVRWTAHLQSTGMSWPHTAPPALWAGLWPGA